VHENINNIRPKKGVIYMNVLTILGSPRAKGNTAHILNQFVLGIQHADSEAEINHIFLQNKNIKNCIGCNSCQRVGACVLQDDMNDIYPLIKNADVLVLATPVFVFNMTAQLKGFLDRLYAVDKELFKETRIVLLTTYGELALYSRGEHKDPLVEKYQKILKETEELIIIFPIWWFDVPAILKGFLDKVMLKDFAYIETSTGLKGLLTNIKKTTVITTSNSPKWYLKYFAGNPIKGLFIKTNLKGVGIKNVRWLHCAHTKKEALQKRKDFLQYIDKFIGVTTT
jgi:NAD(P)H dehydrogenase (quinone)